MRVQEVPVFIINRNRVTTTSDLVNWLLNAGTTKITIMDNASTYEPLFEYYNNMPEGVIMHSMGGNYGSQGFWNQLHWHLNQTEPFIITDSDCVPSPECPKDLVDVLYDLLFKHRACEKAGTGLRIDNIPDCYNRKQDVLSWEARFWKNRAGPNAWYADIDTTFALYPPRMGWSNGPQNIRTDVPYLCEHRPWYEDSANMSEEEKYYRAHVPAGYAEWSLK